MKEEAYRVRNYARWLLTQNRKFQQVSNAAKQVFQGTKNNRHRLIIYSDYARLTTNTGIYGSKRDVFTAEANISVKPTKVPIPATGPRSL